MSKGIKTIYLLLLFIVFSCQPQVEKTNEELDSILTERKRRIDSILKLAEKRKKHRQLSYKEYDSVYQEPKSANTKDLKSSENHQGKAYYLVVGSFKDYENAIAMIEEFEGSEILQGADNINRVSIAKLNNMEEAVEALRYFKSKYPDVQAWLYSK